MTETWHAGDTLQIRGYFGTVGKALYYTATTVIASEDGFVGGWDVWTGKRASKGTINARKGQPVNFYGFSVTAINGCSVGEK